MPKSPNTFTHNTWACVASLQRYFKVGSKHHCALSLHEKNGRKNRKIAGNMCVIGLHPASVEWMKYNGHTLQKQNRSHTYLFVWMPVTNKKWKANGHTKSRTRILLRRSRKRISQKFVQEQDRLLTQENTNYFAPKQTHLCTPAWASAPPFPRPLLETVPEAATW